MIDLIDNPLADIEAILIYIIHFRGVVEEHLTTILGNFFPVLHKIILCSAYFENHLSEVLLVSMNNKCFYGEKRKKNIPELSQNTLISSAAIYINCVEIADSAKFIRI